MIDFVKVREPLKCESSKAEPFRSIAQNRAMNTVTVNSKSLCTDPDVNPITMISKSACFLAYYKRFITENDYLLKYFKYYFLNTCAMYT